MSLPRATSSRGEVRARWSTASSRCGWTGRWPPGSPGSWPQTQSTKREVRVARVEQQPNLRRGGLEKRGNFGDALRHLANLTGCPLLSDSVALSASNWAFNPSSSEGLGGIPLVIAPTKASRAW